MTKPIQEYIDLRMRSIEVCQEKYKKEADYWRGQLSILQELAQVIDMEEIG